jgi:hypothetical protein
VKFETWTPTTYLFWAALLVIVFVTDQFAVTMVALVAFGLSLVWQLVQWIIIRRQRKAHLEAWNYKG